MIDVKFDAKISKPFKVSRIKMLGRPGGLSAAIFLPYTHTIQQKGFPLLSLPQEGLVNHKRDACA